MMGSERSDLEVVTRHPSLQVGLAKPDADEKYLKINQNGIATFGQAAMKLSCDGRYTLPRLSVIRFNQSAEGKPVVEHNPLAIRVP